MLPIGVSETTVTPTLNDSNASYVIKLGGVADTDGTVSLAVGSNIITVEVTAEDETTTRTYTVAITRAPAGYEPDPAVIADVWDYARETESGFDHVLRWMRALKTLGVVADMTAAEAQGYANQYLARPLEPGGGGTGLKLESCAG